MSNKAVLARHRRSHQHLARVTVYVRIRPQRRNGMLIRCAVSAI